MLSCNRRTCSTQGAAHGTQLSTLAQQHDATGNALHPKHMKAQERVVAGPSCCQAVRKWQTSQQSMPFDCRHSYNFHRA